MVEYTEWTAIVFDVAPDDAPATEVVSWAADRWGERKEALKNASKREARQWARQQL